MPLPTVSIVVVRVYKGFDLAQCLTAQAVNVVELLPLCPGGGHLEMRRILLQTYHPNTIRGMLADISNEGSGYPLMYEETRSHRDQILDPAAGIRDPGLRLDGHGRWELPYMKEV